MAFFTHVRVWARYLMFFQGKKYPTFCSKMWNKRRIKQRKDEIGMSTLETVNVLQR